MNSEQAKEILMRYRPGTADATDPEFAEALAEVRRNEELGHWFEKHCLAQEALRVAFKKIPVPEGFQAQIISERPVGMLQKPISLRLAAGVSLAAVILITSFLYARQWLHHREAIGFKAFSQQMVATALSDYGMTASGDLEKIRATLAEQHAPADYQLPAMLKKLTPTGCAVLSWDGRAVSMVCFRSGQPQTQSRSSNTWLVVAKGKPLPGTPKETVPQITLVNDLPTATWTAGGTTYLLASTVGVDFLKDIVKQVYQ